MRNGSSPVQKNSAEVTTVGRTNMYNSKCNIHIKTNTSSKVVFVPAVKAYGEWRYNSSHS
jgi:hypothetical protein